MPEILMLFAQQPTQPGPQPSMFDFMPMFVIFGLIFYFLLIRPQGREKKRRSAMLDGLKKNDRVVTIGGIIGTVTSVRDDEVTLKVDESSNTKITFNRSAIQRIAGDTAPAEAGIAKR